MTPMPLSKFHNDSNAAKQDKDSCAFASLVYTKYLLVLQLGGLLLQLTVDTRRPGQLGIDWSNVNKVSCLRKQ